MPNLNIRLDSHLDTKSKLLLAAGELFAKFGFDSVRTRDIAQRAHLNIGQIVYYFENKEGLYKAVIQDFAEKANLEWKTVSEKMDLNNLTKISFKEDIKKILQGMIKLKFGNSHISFIMQREMLSGVPYAKGTYTDFFKPLTTSMIQIFKTAQDKKIIKADLDPAVLLFSLIHATEGIIISNKAGVTKYCNCPEINNEDVQPFIDQIFKIFIEGALI